MYATTLVGGHYQAGGIEVLVVLTRERGHNEELRKLVADRAQVIEVPLTETAFRPLREVDEEIRSLENFGKFRTLVVTSARCEDYLDVVRQALRDDYEALSVGPATSATLRRAGLTVTTEGKGSSLDLCDDIVHGPVLILAAVHGRRELSDALTSRALAVRRVECYGTAASELSADEIHQLNRADVIFIGAPSAWRVASPHLRPNTWVLVPGRTTWEVVKSDHARVLVGWGEDFRSAWRSLDPATN